jgi:hypothetical protein
LPHERRSLLAMTRLRGVRPTRHVGHMAATPGVG